MEERAGQGGGQHCQGVDRPNPQATVGHLQGQGNEKEEDNVDKKMLVTSGVDQAVGEEPPSLRPFARVEDEGGTKRTRRKRKRAGGKENRVMYMDGDQDKDNGDCE